MPSVYQSCTIEDEAVEALTALKQHFQDIVQQFNTELANVKAAFDELEGTPTAASVTIGSTTDNKVTWTAQSAGRGGNSINITYRYLGPTLNTTTSPATLEPRWPSSEVDGNDIVLTLGVSAAGEIGLSTYIHMLFWLSNPDVTDLVAGALVGTGGDIPVVSPATYLAGGKDRGVTQSEAAADSVAKVFGHQNYRQFMRSIEIPVIENTSDIAQYIKDGDKYIVVNGKLLIVDGTNLVAINKLYEILGNDLDKTKEILAQMSSGQPTLVITQNVSITTYEVICGELQPVVTVTETYRNLNTSVDTTIAVYGGIIDSLNLYIFWGEQANSTQAANNTLSRWGISDDYIGDVLSGESPEAETWVSSPAPEVFVVDNLTLLADLKFTDTELEELLAQAVDGVQIPHKVSMTARVRALKAILGPRPATDNNGLRNRVKAPIAAMQGVDIGQTVDDQNLAKELATRGKACARTQSRLEAANIGGFNIPDLSSADLPNLPFDQLPDPAKKIESAYGALSNAISTANRTFDLMTSSLTETVGGILNKVQNIASLTDNLFGNDLAKCLLGTSSQSTGMPEFTGVGEGGGNSIPQIQDVLGGLPIPQALLKDAFQAMSIELDEAITDSFETMMGLVQTPLCIAQSLMSSLSGFDLGGLLDICQDGKDPETQCSPEDVQSVIDQSADLTSALSTIPSLEDAPTTLTQYAVEETVEEFTGLLKKSATESTQAVTRGIKEVLDEIDQSVTAKIEMVEQFDKAIRELFGDVRDIKENADEEEGTNTGCAPAVLGMFTDAVTDYL